MSQSDIKDEINTAPEPLLPVEKKLIGWSLGIGRGLLSSLPSSTICFRRRSDVLSYDGAGCAAEK